MKGLALTLALLAAPALAQPAAPGAPAAPQTGCACGSPTQAGGPR